MYKIYINDHPLILTDQMGAPLNREQDVLGAYYLGQPKQLLNFIDKLEKSPDPPTVVLQCEDLSRLKKDFWSLHKKVKAAGGVIINDHGEVLFIKRLGIWDLPKGKRDHGEKNKDTALREVEEEVGLKCTILRKLPKTYHTYRLSNGRRVLKPTAWYTMRPATSEVVLQTSEHITAYRWMTIAELVAQDLPIYASLSNLLLTSEELL